MIYLGRPFKHTDEISKRIRCFHNTLFNKKLIQSQAQNLGLSYSLLLS